MRSLEELKQQVGLCIKGRLLGPDPLTESYELYHGSVIWGSFCGSVVFGFNEAGLMEHVSVSLYNRRKLPSWEDMCKLKDMFFCPEEMVVQIHPAEANYLHGVGGLNNVLHLWRPKDGDFSILNQPERWQ